MIYEMAIAISLCGAIGHAVLQHATPPPIPPAPIIETEEPASFWEEIPLERDVQEFIVWRCEELDISPTVVFAMIYKESTYNADAIGDNGRAFGLMQIHPRWHAERMDELGCDDLLDPMQNVTVGLHYLEELLDRYESLEAALVAYNKGHYKGKITNYAITVMEEARRMEDVLFG